MTLRRPPSSKPGEYAGAYERLTDGALFRPGPDGRAETLFGDIWVPAGWSNCDLLEPLFVPHESGDKSDRGVKDISEDR